MESLGEDLPQLTTHPRACVTHCMRRRPKCMLAIENLGTQGAREEGMALKHVYQTGTIDQASEQGRERGGRPATDLFSNSQSVLRTPPPKKKESSKKGRRRGNSFEGRRRAVTNERAEGRTPQRFLQAMQFGSDTTLCDPSFSRQERRNEMVVAFSEC